jgi:ABC-type bacteriocin/lantibiotic exporter with double-glycine peptidase domain
MTFATNYKPKTIIHSLFDELHVNYTDPFLEEIVYSHPNSGSLLGIGDILNDYKVENVSLKVDPQKFNQLESPFIAQRVFPKAAFNLVRKIDENEVTYINETGETLTEKYQDFTLACSGIILLAEKQENSIEPDYAYNKRVSRFDRARIPLPETVEIGIETGQNFCY